MDVRSKKGSQGRIGRHGRRIPDLSQNRIMIVVLVQSRPLKIRTWLGVTLPVGHVPTPFPHRGFFKVWTKMPVVIGCGFELTLFNLQRSGSYAFHLSLPGSLILGIFGHLVSIIIASSWRPRGCPRYLVMAQHRQARRQLIHLSHRWRLNSLCWQLPTRYLVVPLLQLPRTPSP